MTSLSITRKVYLAMFFGLYALLVFIPIVEYGFIYGVFTLMIVPFVRAGVDGIHDTVHILAANTMFTRGEVYRSSDNSYSAVDFAGYLLFGTHVNLGSLGPNRRSAGIALSPMVLWPVCMVLLTIFPYNEVYAWTLAIGMLIIAGIPHSEDVEHAWVCVRPRALELRSTVMEKKIDVVDPLVFRLKQWYRYKL